MYRIPFPDLHFTVKDVVAKIKAIFAGMLEKYVETLATTRKSRLKHGEVELIKETMMGRLKAIVEEEKSMT